MVMPPCLVALVPLVVTVPLDAIVHHVVLAPVIVIVSIKYRMKSIKIPKIILVLYHHLFLHLR